MDPSLHHTLKEAMTIGEYNREREGIEMVGQTIGIDLAKHVFQLHGVDAHGRGVLRKKLSRTNL
jgi:transposase